MTQICIFNPEHDLCLANGDKNFVPPRSASLFADNCHNIMQTLYGNAFTTSVNTLKQLQLGDFSDIEIIPWGWNAALKQSLLKFGFPEKSLPADDYLAWIRKMQHRSSFLPLLCESKNISNLNDLNDFLGKNQNIVLKAAWSGSGRGLRRVFGQLTEKDLAWAKKMIHEQVAFIAEPLRDIELELALEYDKGAFVGYSLFSSKNGVYQSNVLLYDSEIEELINKRTSQLATQKLRVERWLTENIFPYYQNPLGVDCYIDKYNNLYISELNLRHTMGLVAHAFLQRNPDKHRDFYKP